MFNVVANRLGHNLVTIAMVLAVETVINKAKHWWTRTQRIRTAGSLSLEIALLNASPAPLYQRIAPAAVQLRQLGLNLSAISRRLRANAKTVAKALKWMANEAGCRIDTR